MADILILGGGPGGATLAGLAAARGARVLLVERARFPRDKVCGEFVSAEGCDVLARLGVLERLRDAGATVIDSWRITDTRGRAIRGELPQLPGHGRKALGVSRSLLDGALLELARQRGARVWERWEASTPLLEKRRVAGVRLRKVGSRGAGMALRAAVVVAADGRRSILLRALRPAAGDPTRTRPGSWFGLQIHLAGDSSALRGLVELHVFRGGYAGLAVVEGGRVNLCLICTVAALRACGGSPDRLLQERVLANPAAADELRGLRPCSPWKGVGPLRFGPRHPALAGALLVGDAAGTIDPYSGEGISNALRGAELAAPRVLQAASRGALTADLARAYQRGWTRTFAPVTRRVRWLGRLLEHPRLADAAAGALARHGRALLPRLAVATRTGGR